VENRCENLNEIFCAIKRKKACEQLLDVTKYYLDVTKY
jgi:hypothetical protein